MRLGQDQRIMLIVLEEKIYRWNGFARALRKDDREAFEELMDICRSYAFESSNATNPIVFEPMVMSIILAQQEIIRQIEKSLNVNQSARNDSSIAAQTTPENHQAVTNIPQRNLTGGEQTRLS